MAMKQREGFTLVSVIVAVMLLSVGIMALANAQFYAVRRASLENQKTLAIQLLSAYAEEIRSRDPWTLANEGPVTIDSTGAVNAQGKFVRRLVVSDEAAQLLRAQLWVVPIRANAAAARGDTVRLETMIFKVIS
jgi:type IV pilus assembly protein PilV